MNNAYISILHGFFIIKNLRARNNFYKFMYQLVLVHYKGYFSVQILRADSVHEIKINE